MTAQPEPSANPHTDTALPRRRLMAGCALGSALLASGLLPATARAAVEAAAFEARTLDEVLRAFGARPVDSREVSLTIPEIAENGAVVPLTLASNLARVQAMFIIVERNPTPLVAAYTLAEGTEAFISTRVRMAESSRVHAVVRADGRLYSTVRETRVTLGGCGV